MGIYLGLIGGLVGFSLLVKAAVPDREKGERLILVLGMAAIFLLLVLKKDTVGMDILGYRRQYRIAAAVLWRDFDYVYFEKGYVLLMKIFAKSGLPFRCFTLFIYSILCLGYYRFLKRFSENVTLSLLMLICYQFLVFHTSGLRQSLAMGICLLAFLQLEEGHWVRGLGMALLAAAFHRGALAFLAVFPVYGLRKRKIPGFVYLAGIGAAVALRPVLWKLAGLIFSDISYPGGIDVGGNLIFLAGIAAFGLYTLDGRGSELDRFFARMGYGALLTDLVLSGSSLLRCNLFFTLFLLAGVPNAVSRYERRTQVVLNTALGCFLIVLFYGDTLAINQLGLLPYRFFWQ